MYKFKFFHTYHGVLDLEKKINSFFKENLNYHLYKAELQADFSRGEPYSTVMIQYVDSKTPRSGYDVVFKFFVERSNPSILDSRITEYSNSFGENLNLLFAEHKMSISTGTSAPLIIAMLAGTLQLEKPKKEVVQVQSQRAKEVVELAKEILETESETPVENELAEEKQSNRQPIIFKSNNELAQMVQDGQAKI